MKNLLSSLLVFAFILISQSLFAQSSFELQSKGADDQHFVTIKGYEVKGGEKYPYMFSNLSMYKIKLKGEKNPLIVKILDEKEQEIASNYNPETKEYSETFAYKCGKTGRYYLKFENASN